MALVSCAPFVWPSNITMHPPGSANVAKTANASGEGTACVFLIPETGTINKVTFYLGSVTNANASTRITVSLYTVDTATGLPTATLLDPLNGQYDKTGAGQLTANAWNTFDFTGVDGNGAASVTKGQRCACALVMTTVGGADSFDVSTTATSTAGRPQFPYLCTDTGGGVPVWAKVSTEGVNVVLEYATNTYHVAPELAGYLPATATTNEERGNRFQVPFPCRISGVVMPGWRQKASNTTFTIHLMADATAPAGARLASTETMEDDVGGQTGTHSKHDYLRFTTPYEASKNTWYRVVVAQATGAVTLVKSTGLSNAALNQTLGTINYYWTEDNGAGSWDNAQTSAFANIRLVIDKVDDGTGGASGGGLRLAGRGGLASGGG